MRNSLDRLISEQAVIDAVSEWLYDKTRKESIETVIKAIPPAEPQKIPVSERLPEDDGLYLVYTEEQPFVCPFEDGKFFIDEVIAWIPLPPWNEPQESEG